MGTEVTTSSGWLSYSEPACLWSRLPFDLWFKVLSSLRPKSLFQLRRVSKTFYSFITEFYIPRLAAPISGFIFRWYTEFLPPEDCFPLPSKIPPEEFKPHKKFSPSFGCEEEDFVIEYIHDYVAICRNNKGQGSFKRDFITWYVSLLPFKMSETDDFLGCFNGFILVTDSFSLSGHVPYYLCNPATKQCITIPVNPTHSKLEKDPFVFLAFDPLDPPPHHFKIVRLTNPTKELDIFSSATGSWTKHAIHFDDPDDEILRSEVVRHCIYLNGVLYMLSMTKYLLSFDLRVSYDSTNVKLKACAIRLPYISTRDDYLGLFDASNRCLYYAYSDEHELIVWTFQVKGHTWLLKYRISICDLEKLRNGGWFWFSVWPCIVYAVDLREEIIFFGDIGFVRSYHIKTNHISLVCHLEMGTILSAESCFYIYSICLVKLFDQFPFTPEFVAEALPIPLLDT